MEWPERPVEEIPPEEFRPPYCPRKTCGSQGEEFRYSKHARYSRQCDGRIVPRFRCRACRKTFSQQTFACSYYLKRPDLLCRVAAELLAGSAHRQIARTEEIAASTVTRLSARLGRHALLLMARALDRLPEISEPIVYDDLETFFASQDLPCGLGTAIGLDSWFLYAVEHAPHRRSGRPRPAHKSQPRHPAPEPEPGAYRHAFGRLLDLLIPKRSSSSPLQVITDDHPGYHSALRDHPARQHVVHRVFPNPPSRPSDEARQRDGAMFPADQLHGLLRHSQSAHKRETIAFGRRLNALLERGFLAAVWRNWVKGRSERKPDPTTPAMHVGLASEPWRWKRVLARRLFPWRTELPDAWLPIYRRDLITPEIGANTRHRLRYAF